MRMLKKKNQQGFTLVELAIVLVIIGLIVSSVLVGQDLIRSAELRATTKQYQEFQVAVNTFINKFGQIPGDIEGDVYGLTGGCDAGTAGDGDQNGIITELASATAISDHDGEIACFWSNLTSAITGYVPGTYDGDDTVADVIGENLPQMKLGTAGWGVYGVSGINYFITGVIGSQTTNTYNTRNVFVPVDAFNIDDKIDDGVATTGNVVSRAATAAGAPDLAGLVGCNNTTTGVYTFTGTAAACNLRFKMVTF